MKPDSLPDSDHGNSNLSTGRKSNRSIPSKNARITIFHVLWLVIALGGAVICYGDAMKRGFSTTLRILESLAGGVVGFIIGQFAILLLVTGIVIPRLKPGSAWSYEVNCYMSQMFGKIWDDLDRKQEKPSEENERKTP